MVTLGIIGHFNLKSVNDKGGKFMLPTMVWGSCGQGGAEGQLGAERQPRTSVLSKD